MSDADSYLALMVCCVLFGFLVGGTFGVVAFLKPWRDEVPEVSDDPCSAAGSEACILRFVERCNEGWESACHAARVHMEFARWNATEASS